MPLLIAVLIFCAIFIGIPVLATIAHTCNPFKGWS